MAWRFNDPVSLSLSRREASDVHDLLTTYVGEFVPKDDESYARIWAVIARMKAQIEHKPGTGPLRNKESL